MFEMDLSQQARQSKHFPPCLELTQLKSSPVDAPEVTRPSRFAIAVGGFPSNIKADNRIVRLAGTELLSIKSDTKENSRVGSQNRMFGKRLAISTIAARCATDWTSPLSCQRKNAWQGKLEHWEKHSGLSTRNTLNRYYLWRSAAFPQLYIAWRKLRKNNTASCSVKIAFRFWLQFLWLSLE